MGDLSGRPEGPRNEYDGQNKGPRYRHLTATVETVGADVVTQVRFTGSGFHSNAWHIQGIVRAVHTALGRGFFVLLNGHDGS
eukprot:gene4731-4776_t